MGVLVVLATTAAPAATAWPAATAALTLHVVVSVVHSNSVRAIRQSQRDAVGAVLVVFAFAVARFFASGAAADVYRRFMFLNLLLRSRGGVHCASPGTVPVHPVDHGSARFRP
jgi:hypothetical protein